MIKKAGIVALLMVAVIACAQDRKPTPTESKAKINTVLDDWHQAASDADFDSYFNHFASDSAIFMGTDATDATDATERWTVPEFKAFAKPYFNAGRAWNFTPEQRHVYLSGSGETAWFDETLDTPNLGPARGTGVLVKQASTWKIAHYTLSIPIPNAIADTVVKQVEQALTTPDS